MNDLQNRMAQQGLVRPASGRVLAGVCAGLGQRFGIGPWMARLLLRAGAHGHPRQPDPDLPDPVDPDARRAAGHAGVQRHRHIDAPPSLAQDQPRSGGLRTSARLDGPGAALDLAEVDRATTGTPGLGLPDHHARAGRAGGHRGPSA